MNGKKALTEHKYLPRSISKSCTFRKLFKYIMFLPIH